MLCYFSLNIVVRTVDRQTMAIYLWCCIQPERSTGHSYVTFCGQAQSCCACGPGRMENMLVQCQDQANTQHISSGFKANPNLPATLDTDMVWRQMAGKCCKWDIFTFAAIKRHLASDSTAQLRRKYKQLGKVLVPDSCAYWCFKVIKHGLSQYYKRKKN